MKTLITNGMIVTLNNKSEVLNGDLLIEDGKIKQISKKIVPSKQKDRFDHIVNARGGFVIPGLVQAHTHLCQTLFRGFADDLVLMDWLEQKIWPMENGHTEQSLYDSARIGLLEMQMSGTTTILDMGTVNHTDSIFEAANESGIRFIGGNCLMDLKGSCGPLWQGRKPALKEVERLIRKWHKKSKLLNYTLNPRFAISCSDELLRDCVEIQKSEGIRIHTHASESLGEIAIVKTRTGMENVDYLDSLKMLNPKTIIVHGVHLKPRELKKMIRSGTALVHCPSSNLKLASGIAPIEHYHNLGLKIGIGSDGAPCNNSMDPFIEMRLTALLQKPKFGPRALPAKTALELATIGGAKTLGLEDKIGSLEVGKCADIVIVEKTHPSVGTVEDPYSALVYGCLGRDVTHVWTDGVPIVINKTHHLWKSEEVIQKAKREFNRLKSRINLI